MVRTGEVFLGNVDVATTATLKSEAGSFNIKSLTAPQVDLTGRVGSIEIQDLSAAKAKLQTEFGAVRGSYEVIEELSLNTTTGSIDVDVALPGNGDAGSQEQVARVQALSTAGSIGVKYTTQDPSVKLHSLLQTTTGSCTLTHHPTYEGTFELESGYGSVSFDLSDENKTVVANVDEQTWSGRRVKGMVWRPRAGNPHGSSMVKTRMGSIKAIL